MSSSAQDNDLPYWIAFNQIEAVGPRSFQLLLKAFNTLENAWQANAESLHRSGVKPSIVKRIIERRPDINPHDEWQKLATHGVGVITSHDERYPESLKTIFAPPPVLYYRGNLNSINNVSLAIVGSRKPTGYGQLVTETLTAELVLAGLTIVSGLALGVDSIAHQTALKHSGTTIAVLGSGLNQLYPSSNRRLAHQIIDHGGLIVSEFAINALPLKHHFPQRNRLIAGLSVATLVTEAGQTSGALSTARHTLDQGKDVFAVPGQIVNRQADGVNYLISSGAQLVINGQTILEALQLANVPAAQTVRQLLPTTETERQIITLLENEPVHVDKLARSARLEISRLNSTLTVMEMKGLIRNIGNQTYLKL